MSDKAIRTMTGMVVSCNSDKTAVAKIDKTVKHPKLGKIIRRSSKISFHDEANVCSLGDKVTIKECRPISKTKSWTLVEILKEGKS